MPSTTSIVKTGNPDIDGLLGSKKWAVQTLTYSFPGSSGEYNGYLSGEEPFNNFDLLNATQRAAVRQIYSEISGFTNLTFREAAGGTGDLRFAMTDDTATASAYYPSSSAKGGDSWFNNSGGKYDNPVKGNYAYQSFLHEMGHTLGLKHGHVATAMTAAHDSMEYTVMTYRSYVNGPTTGYTNETGGYAQTFMMYDIAALQHLYGANYSTNAGDTTYSWNPLTGAMSLNGVAQAAPLANRVFMTVWDGGGTDTYDLSAYANAVTIDLRPGEWTTTSALQLANLGDGRSARGNVANALLFNGDTRSLIENAIGGSANDAIFGNTAANTLDGRGGSDTIALAGAQSNYTFSGTATNFTATGFGATDTILNAEFVRFLGSNTTVGVASLLTSTPDDYRDSLTDTTAPLGSVLVGRPERTGNIEVAGDADVFRVTLEAGQIYRFDLQGAGSGGGTLADPYLFLRNGAGAVLAQDDDAGTGLDSRITFTATASGAHYLDAQEFGNNATGTYMLNAVLV